MKTVFFAALVTMLTLVLIGLIVLDVQWRRRPTNNGSTRANSPDQSKGRQAA
jgi:hypothetical protein